MLWANNMSSQLLTSFVNLRFFALIYFLFANLSSSLNDADPFVVFVSLALPEAPLETRHSEVRDACSLWFRIVRSATP